MHMNFFFAFCLVNYDVCMVQEHCNLVADEEKSQNIIFNFLRVVQILKSELKKNTILDLKQQTLK